MRTLIHPGPVAGVHVNLSNALMLEHWAFAADLLASKVGSEFTCLFVAAVDARMNWSSTTRSASDQLHDVLTLEVASAQDAPLVPC